MAVIFLLLLVIFLELFNVFTFFACWWWLLAWASLYDMIPGLGNKVPVVSSTWHEVADRSCSSEIWTFKTVWSLVRWVTSPVKLVTMARNFSTKWIVVCPLSLTVSFWTLRDQLLVSSGKFNCPYGDETMCVASDADKDHWGLTGVSPFLVDLKAFIFKDLVWCITT